MRLGAALRRLGEAGHTLRLLRTPVPGETEFIEALVEHTHELLADAPVRVETNGKEITFAWKGEGASKFQSTRPLGRLRGPEAMNSKLETVLRSHGERVQAFLSRARGRPWPTAGARVCADVGDEQLRLWWSESDGESLAEMPPISRREVGI